MTKEQKSPEEIAQKILETMEDEIYGLEYSSGELKAAKYLIAQAIDNSNTEAIDWTDPKLKEHHPDGSIRPNRWAKVDDEYNRGYADAMLKKAGCCELNEIKLLMATQCLEAIVNLSSMQKGYSGKALAESILKQIAEMK